MPRNARVPVKWVRKQLPDRPEWGEAEWRAWFDIQHHAETQGSREHIKVLEDRARRSYFANKW